MKNILHISLLAGFLFVSPSHAAEQVKQSDKIQLQAAMQKSISRQVVEGRFFHFDVKNDKTVTLFPAKAHPMILRFGEHFILCTEFRNEHGKNVNVDFYLARRDDAFVVFETVVDNRKPVQRLMKSGHVSVVK